MTINTITPEQFQKFQKIRRGIKPKQMVQKMKEFFELNDKDIEYIVNKSNEFKKQNSIVFDKYKNGEIAECNVIQELQKVKNDFGLTEMEDNIHDIVYQYQKYL